ncbi:hypothetical protein DPMN_096439 [Dreissena polymorpha]|uniref:Uncharacterized protein n=1 Tax=Dreissena polymorpha TaxID=45954 RepID=A0A9D4LBD0_DREPO|nr:hypothetical protein DPMN_096439 [Dreissena polymorpha]
MASLRLFAGKKANNHSTTFRHVTWLFSRALIGVELRDIAQNTRQTSYIRKRRNKYFEKFGATRFENDSDDIYTMQTMLAYGGCMCLSDKRSIVDEIQIGFA